jgi:hypothetical protein
MTKAPRQKQTWPKELSEPLLLERKNIAPEKFKDQLFNDIEARIAVIARHLRCGAPITFDIEWFTLLRRVCEHWDIPAFQDAPLKKRGPGTKWSARQYCELYADVQVVRKAVSSDAAACAHIAKNPKRFGFRYSRMGKRDDSRKLAATLRRQYAAAKKLVEKDGLFRLLNLGIGGLLNQGVDTAQLAIARYAFERN